MNGIMSKLLVALALLLAVTGCAKQPPTPDFPPSDAPLQVGVAISTNDIYIGDTFDVTLIAVHPSNTILRVPSLEQPDRQLVVRNQQERTDTLPDGRLQTTYRYNLTSFRIGTHLLSSGLVACVDATSLVSEVSFPDTRIAVHSVLSGKEESLQDIKGVMPWPGRIPRWIWAFALISLMAVAIGLAARYLLNKPRTILHAAPPTPPHQIALAALRALQQKGWIEAEQVEPFYVELSRIARQYLEDRFHLRAPEQTTEEFIREAVHSRKLSNDHQQLLRDFLEQSDLVKFARHRPGPDDMQNAFAAAERLVLDTQPAKEEEPS
ncbi:MAG: hypothetical protein EOM20_18670 [Spartobacteria bacterium]|nr:hypothetical protein [Spartobacteria bacterium]